jgi:prepilin-type N-terminal cleavage/methylation domain-containing protein/prepilin-type processing-associated H-X9-DG protein
MKSKAFTLVELLVVIAIIALLISILVPTMGMARDQSKALICQNNLRQLISGAHAYAADNEDFYPLAIVAKKQGTTIVSGCWDFTTTTAGGQRTVEPGILWLGGTTIKVQQCPAYNGPANWEIDPFTGYNYNASFIGGRAGYEDNMLVPKFIIPSARLTDVRSSGATVVFGDGEFKDGANKFMRSPLPGSLDSDFGDRCAGSQGFRHQDKTNAAMADGSTQTFDVPIRDVPGQQCAEGTGFLSADNSAYDLK